MPVWGARYIEYLLTFGLPTLLAPNNLPWLPNRAVSQFTFITTVEDEKHIRASKLFAKLEALMPVKFICLDFRQSGDRQEKFDQLGNGLKRGANEALGRGFCMFCQPDSIYSDGILKFLYGVARSGKKACVSHGPSATLEGIEPYLRERNRLTFDEVNPLPSRVLANALIDNLHPDEAVHCMGHPHYPLDPYMGFWLSPKLDGALYRFVSLHPFIVDLSHLSEVVDFGAIDHNFIRSHEFVWSDVHVETDSDNFLVVNAKPEKERNVVPNPDITHSPITCLTQALHKPSNDAYSRFCFFHGLKVHTGDLDRDWHIFEAANLRWLSTSTNAILPRTIGNADLSVASPSGLLRMALTRLFRAETCKFYWRLFASRLEKLFRLVVVERRPLEALKYSLNALRKLVSLILGPIYRPMETPSQVVEGGPAVSSAIATEFCAVCRSDARRCVSRDDRAVGT
jgi:hypothetical protein